VSRARAFWCLARSEAGRRQAASTVSGRRLCEADNLVIGSGHDHTVDATAAAVNGIPNVGR
jgi:hypothetical protein